MAGQQSALDKKMASTVISELTERGAEAIILGCTELPLAIEQSDSRVPVLNSNEIIVDRALAIAFS